MDPAAETAQQTLPPTKGDHPVLSLPFTVGIDGRNHAGRGLSLVSAEISGLVDPALEGAIRLVRLIFPFNGFTVVLSLRARIQHVEPGEGRAVLVFLDPAGEHLPQLRHILNSWIAGDLVSLGETIGVTATHATAPRPATRSRRGSRLLGTLGMTVATLALFALAAGILVSRSYAVPLSLPGAVTWDSRALSAVAAGQIDYINPDASKGEVAFALRATTGETLSIAMPCDCDAEPAGPVAGSTVLAGEPVLVLKDADAALIVTAPVLPEDLARLAFAERVAIDFSDGTRTTATLDATRLMPAANGTPQPLRLQPDTALPAAMAGQSVRLTALKPMPAILEPVARILPAFGR